MFEEEAEEYAGNREVCDLLDAISEDLQNYDYGTVAHYNIDPLVEECFKDDAEFGYNKVNEWHKQEVDDIYDLISEDWSVRYFICIMKDKIRVNAIGNCDEDCNGDISVNLVFDYDDKKYCFDDIVWWKEIVLPKEPKEND